MGREEEQRHWERGRVVAVDRDMEREIKRL